MGGGPGDRGEPVWQSGPWSVEAALMCGGAPGLRALQGSGIQPGGFKRSLDQWSQKKYQGASQGYPRDLPSGWFGSFSFSPHSCPKDLLGQEAQSVGGPGPGISGVGNIKSVFPVLLLYGSFLLPTDLEASMPFLMFSEPLPATPSATTVPGLSLHLSLPAPCPHILPGCSGFLPSAWLFEVPHQSLVSVRCEEIGNSLSSLCHLVLLRGFQLGFNLVFVDESV